MEIELTKETLTVLDHLSRESGMSRKDIISRAISNYIKSLRNQKKLKKELSTWEKAGLEDSEAFLSRNNL